MLDLSTVFLQTSLLVIVAIVVKIGMVMIMKESIHSNSDVPVCVWCGCYWHVSEEKNIVWCGRKGPVLCIYILALKACAHDYKKRKQYVFYFTTVVVVVVVVVVNSSSVFVAVTANGLLTAILNAGEKNPKQKPPNIATIKAFFGEVEEEVER